MSAEPARLHPDDLEQLAVRVAELLREEPAPASDGLLTADEVGDRLRCSRRYVLRLAREGKLDRSKRPGRRGAVLFEPAAVDRYLEGLRGEVDVGASAAHVVEGPVGLPVVRPRRRERLR